jgi:ribosome-associated protein
VLTLSVSESRSQHRNREIALERLADLIRNALVVQRVRRPTKPSRSAKKRRLESKKKRGAVKKNRGKVKLD